MINPSLTRVPKAPNMALLSTYSTSLCQTMSLLYQVSLPPFAQIPTLYLAHEGDFIQGEMG